ncbi:MAG: GNAT family N-acetyltransferase [Chloroflexota bacterium]
MPEKRGQGLMGKLLDAVVTEMERQGGLELRLYVHQGNKRAIRAYEKAGFKPSPYKLWCWGAKIRRGCCVRVARPDWFWKPVWSGDRQGERDCYNNPETPR